MALRVVLDFREFLPGSRVSGVNGEW